MDDPGCWQWVTREEIIQSTPDEHVDTAVETLLRTSQSEFPVVDGASRPMVVLGRADLIRALRERGPDACVADVMTTGIPTVNKNRCLEDAFSLLQEKAAPAVAIVDGLDRKRSAKC